VDDVTPRPTEQLRRRVRIRRFFRKLVEALPYDDYDHLGGLALVIIEEMEKTDCTSDPGLVFSLHRERPWASLESLALAVAYARRAVDGD
jgi:hypothetical protein